MPKEWDAFISHASEDKDFVQPLVVSLGHMGVEVWYDEINLTLGEDLTRSIDQGLANSRFGLVVISKHFLQKKWTDYELRGLLSREIGTGTKLIIPIWHGVGLADVLTFSPPLAGKYALDTAKTAKTEDLLLEIVRVVRPDIYQRHSRAELERIMSGKELENLKAQISELEEKLAESRDRLSELADFACPTCEAPLVTKFSTEEEDDYREYACGYTVSDYVGSRRLCPSDPKFPKLDEYDLVTTKEGKGWVCVPRPKTKTAGKLNLSRQYGSTKDEAQQMVKDSYSRAAKPLGGY
jgi:hypothetical protein